MIQSRHLHAQAVRAFLLHASRFATGPSQVWGLYVDNGTRSLIAHHYTIGVSPTTPVSGHVHMLRGIMVCKLVQLLLLLQSGVI